MEQWSTYEPQGRASSPLRADDCNHAFLPGKVRRARRDAPYLGQSVHSPDAHPFLEVEASHEPYIAKTVENIGVFEGGIYGPISSGQQNPSPLGGGGERRLNLGPPPTRPTHQTEKANLPNGNTLAGVTKQSYCRVLEPIFPTGTKAPESLAATLHAAADESESLRFMGTINFCLRKSSLPMNRAVVTPTFQSARLAGWKTGETKPNGFMTPMRGKILEILLPTTCRWTFGFFRDFE